VHPVRFRPDELEGIAAGEITLAFRRWDRPRARVGARHRTPAGELEILAVDEVDPAAITDADARAAGAPSAEALLAGLRADRPRTYRVALRLAGPDGRVALREEADLDDSAVAAIAARLARLDAASRRGPWTGDVLRLVEARPGVRAADLATELSRETQPFKRDVRKLKELGLTESLEVGYRLSPRGAAFLARTR
jgi:hypothetical protein